MTTQEGTVIFRSRTDTVTVPVVVRDSSGRAVGNLHKEDFRLTDKGKPQSISTFSIDTRGADSAAARRSTAAPAGETGAGQPPAPVIPHRFVAYVFDNRHLSPADLMAVRDAAKRHFASFGGPDVRAAVYLAMGHGTEEFTADRSEIEQALSIMAPSSETTTQPQCNETTHFIADRIWNIHDPDADEMLTLELRACNPNGNLDSIKRQVVLRALQIGDNETGMTMDLLNKAVSKLATMPGERTLVLASGGFLATSESRYGQDKTIERAVRANVRINALDARGLYVPMIDASTALPATSEGAKFDSSFYRYQTLRSNLDKQAAARRHDVLAELAAGTGGVDFQNSNDLEGGFNRLAAADEVVYLLAFSPQNLRHDGGFHPLKVTAPGFSGLTIEARRGYYAPTQLADAAEQAKEEIREAVFSRGDIRDFPIDVVTQFFKPDPDSARLTVLAHIDIKGMRFRPAEGRNLDNLSMAAALFDRDGNYVSGYAKDVAMRLKDATLQRLVNEGIQLKLAFNTAPGVYQLRVVVRDSENEAMAAQSAVVEIP